MYLTTYFDYRIISSTIIKAVKTIANVPCIESSSSGAQPNYPFATFTVTSPHITNQHDAEGSQFELVLSLTYHDTSSINVLNIAKMTESFLGSEKSKKMFAEKGIVVVSIDGFSKRDNFISIDFERSAGFDVRLRVAETFVDDIDPIENIIIGGS